MEQNGKWVIDTNALIDGHVVLALADCRILRHAFVPERVLDELQRLAFSADRSKEGRRGLIVLTKLLLKMGPTLEMLRSSPEYNKIDVDGELVEWAVKLDAWLLTGDNKLQQRAQERGVETLGYAEFKRAVAHSSLLVGDEISVEIEAAGRLDGQGVGHLADGTLIVVNGGLPYMGKTLRVLVTQKLDNGRGSIAFAEPVCGGKDEAVVMPGNEAYAA
jgi:uncharacterized protein YacL